MSDEPDINEQFEKAMQDRADTIRNNPDHPYSKNESIRKAFAAAIEGEEHE